MKVFFPLLLLFSLGYLAGCQSTQTAQVTLPKKTLGDNLWVEQLSDDVWMHTTAKDQSDGSIRFSNGLLVLDQGQLVLIDTPWGNRETDLLLDWTISDLKAQVSAAVVTHFHEDRMAGVKALKSRGIPYYSHTLTRILWPDPTVRMPQSLDMLKIGDRVGWHGMELFYPGPGHSEDNIVAWLPKQKILFAGSFLRSETSNGLGDTADANIRYWPKAIRRLQREYTDPLTVVTAEGKPEDKRVYQYNLEILGSH